MAHLGYPELQQNDRPYQAPSSSYPAYTATSHAPLMRYIPGQPFAPLTSLSISFSFPEQQVAQSPPPYTHPHIADEQQYTHPSQYHPYPSIKTEQRYTPTASHAPQPNSIKAEQYYSPTSLQVPQMTHALPASDVALTPGPSPYMAAYAFDVPYEEDRSQYRVHPRIDTPILRPASAEFITARRVHRGCRGRGKKAIMPRDDGEKREIKLEGEENAVDEEEKMGQEGEKTREYRRAERKKMKAEKKRKTASERRKRYRIRRRERKLAEHEELLEFRRLFAQGGVLAPAAAVAVKKEDGRVGGVVIKHEDGEEAETRESADEDGVIIKQEDGEQEYGGEVVRSRQGVSAWSSHYDVA